MFHYAIIETDAGMAVAELPPGVMAEDAAISRGGVVVDPGPFENYEEAYDAMLALEDEDDEEE